MISQITDSIEKETKVEIKDDNPLKSEEIKSVQRSEKPSIYPINSMENNKDSVQESYIPPIDFIEDKMDLVVVPLAPVKSLSLIHI